MRKGSLDFDLFVRCKLIFTKRVEQHGLHFFVVLRWNGGGGGGQGSGTGCCWVVVVVLGGSMVCRQEDHR